MKINLTKSIIILSAASALFIYSSCESLGDVTKVSAKVFSTAGVISDSTANAIGNTVDAIDTAKTSFSLEEEYYIGRGVAASILQKYSIYKNKDASTYVSNIMETLILNSASREMFNGYHLAILDTDEINAFATSGGHILVTRGLLKRVESEEQIAAVISHELAHIQKNHSIESISNDRKKNAWKALGAAAVLTTADIVQNSNDKNSKTKVSDNLAQLGELYSSIVGDSVDTLINKGYSKKFEYEADEEALSIMSSSGYDVNAMEEMLTMLEKNAPDKKSGFAKTHPSSKDRKAKLKGKYKKFSDKKTDSESRIKRFEKIKASF